MTIRLVSLSLGLAALGIAACTAPADDKPTMSKDEARELAKGDHGVDYCELFDWYGDGVCDDFCARPDPDCGTCEARIASDEVLVAIEDGGAVSLDAEHGTVRRRFATGPNAFGAIYSADGQRAFVTDKTAGTLSEIDRRTGAVVSTISVGANPQQPAVTRDLRMYIPLSGGAGIAVVAIGATRGAPLTPLRTLPTGDGTKPHIVSLSPDGQTLWATIQGRDPKVVSFPITASGEGTMKEYRYDIVPRVIAGHDRGAYFTGHHSTGIHAVDLATGALSTPFVDEFGAASEARKQVEGVTTNADGSLLAITHEGRKAATVLARDGATAERVRDAAPLSSNPYWVTFDSSGDVMYVSIPGSGTVEAYDVAGCQSTPLWKATVGGKVKRMAVTEAP